jgi:hypothetical protein
MIEETEPVQNRAFREKIYAQIVIGSIVAALIGVTILAIVPANTGDFGSITVEDAVSGSVGHSILSYDSTGYTELTLLDTTNFTYESGWLTRVSWNEGSEVTSYQDAEGLHIEGSNANLRIYRYFNIPVEDYNTLQFTSTIKPIQGEFTVTISAYFGLWWSEQFHIHNSTPIDTGSEYLYELEVSTDWMSNRTGNWLCQARFEILIDFDAFASLVIARASVEVISSTQLYPISIDFQDRTGNSLYENKETRRLMEIPVVNITSEADNRSSILMQWTPNETVYLKLGDYFVEYGWFKLVEVSGVPISNARWIGTFTMALNGGVGISAAIRMNVVELNLDINPGLRFSVNIEGSVSSAGFGDIRLIYVLRNFVPTETTVLYLPDDVGTVYAFVVLSTPNSPHFSTRFDIDGTHHLKLNARFPYHSVFGVALDTVQLFLLLLVVGLLIAAFISLKHSLYPIPITHWLRRERFIPTVLMLLSYVLPWASRKEAVASNQGPTTVWWTTYLASGLETMKAGSGDSIVYVIGIQNRRISSVLDYWDAQGIFPAIFFVFWIPMLIMVYQYFYDSSIRPDASTIVPYAIPGMAALLAPIIYDRTVLLLGFVPAILAFLFVATRAFTRTKKWGLVKEKIGWKQDESTSTE